MNEEANMKLACSDFMLREQRIIVEPEERRAFRGGWVARKEHDEAELERLRAENATLRQALKNHAEEAAKMVKDAQRYQWLRAGTILCWRTELSGKAAFPAATKSALDHEVDAMIAAAHKPE
ncbi:MAG TPA: hypothetical protein VLM42_03145 [Bryobacteraceae bacterium]|nr:hypothetical protein [Bryobacteraceae bacterium]